MARCSVFGTERRRRDGVPEPVGGLDDRPDDLHPGAVLVRPPAPARPFSWTDRRLCRTIWRRLIFQEAKNTARLAQGPPTSYHRPADQWQTRGTTCRMSAAGTRSLAASASLDDVGARSTAQLPTAGFGPLASQRRLWPPPDRAAQEPMKSTIAVRCPAPAPAPTRPVVC